MKLTFRSILNILTDHDLEGLIRMGAPEDEYSLEAGLIYRSLRDLTYIPDLEYIKELIEFVFWRAFEVFVPETSSQVEDLIIRDFYEWQKTMDKYTFEVALEISELMKDDF